MWKIETLAVLGIGAPMDPPVIGEAYRQRRDAEQLNLLAIFHFVFSGLALLMIGFVALHYFFMRHIFLNPAMWRGGRGGGPPPPEIWSILLWVYAFALIVLVSASVLNLLSGLFLRQRRHRIFSLVIATLNCLQVPLGTALGVFTIIVVCRDSVCKLYGEKKRAT